MPEAKIAPTLFLLALASQGMIAQPYLYQAPSGTTVSVYNAATMTEAGVINIGPATSIGFSPTGAEIYATGSGFLYGASTINKDTFAAVYTGDELDFGSAKLAVSPSGKYVYANINGNYVDVLDATSLTTISSFLVAIGAFYSPGGMAISPDGETLYLSLGYEGNCNPCGTFGQPPDFEDPPPGVETIDLKTAKVVSYVPGSGGPIALSPDGSMLAFTSVSANRVHFLNVMNTGTGAVTFFPTPRTSSFSFSEDGTEIYVLAGTQLQTVSIATQQIVGQIALPAAGTALAVDPESGIAYVAAGALLVIDLSQQTIVNTVALPNGSSNLALSPAGGQLYVSTSGNDAISVADTASSQTVGTAECTGSAQALAISADATRLYALCSSNLMSVDALTLKGRQSVAVAAVASSIAVSPSGKYVFVPEANSVAAISTANLMTVKTYALPSNPSVVAVSPDGNSLYALLLHDVEKIDLQSGTVVGDLTLPSGTWGVLAVSPTGDHRAYVGSSNESFGGFILQIDTANMAAVASFAEESQFMTISPDGGTLYSSNGSPEISAIDTATGTLRQTYTLPSAARGMAISSDGSTLYVGEAATGTAIINVSTGTQTALPPPSGTIVVLGSK